jgi:hypothetical protein
VSRLPATILALACAVLALYSTAMGWEGFMVLFSIMFVLSTCAVLG